MRQFWATFLKDLLILWRDRAGMLVLFVMPMALVLVLSLVQNNILAATGQAALRLLFVDQDHGFVANEIRDRLQQAGGVELITELNGQVLSEERARREVAAGHYQFGLLIPAGTSIRLREDSRQLALETLNAAGNSGTAATQTWQLQLFFDPGVQGVFRTAVLSSLRHALLGLETAEKTRQLLRALNAQLGGGPGTADEAADLPVGKSLLGISAKPAGSGEQLQRPNAVQQNVPAWALFGMFFIVVPLSGALLRERQEGTLRRLLVLPAPYSALLAGKVLAYVVICLVQFSLMLLVGKFLLPLLGTPVLQLGEHPAAVFLLALCAALAATGYGLLVGNLARSNEQASMLGAVTVVIAAALGGVMVPVYVMPQGMRLISNFSPLAWGLNGFIELFVRSGGLSDIISNLLLLLGFFVLTLSLSLALFIRRGRSGG